MVRKLSDRVEFRQTVTAANGYAYEYTKIVRLASGAPDMFLEHSLKNTGSKSLESNVYDHNFLINDHQPPGPPLHILFPFEVKTERAMNGLAEARGHELRYLKTLSGDERAATAITGFGSSSSDYDIAIENPATGAGVRITGDQPLQQFIYWSVSSVLAPEPYIHLQVEPGAEFRWTIHYHFYSVH